MQVWHNGWDHHTALKENLTTRANEANQPIAALLADLKERGMLEDTLVIWGGEFAVPAPRPWRPRRTGAITIITDSPCGWPAAA